MDQSQSRPLLLQRFGRFLSQYWKESRLPFLSSLLFGLLAYTFAFTNKLLNHDEAYSLFMKGGTVDSGRWGLGFLDIVFPNISMPWIYGILSIVFLSLMICVTIRIFSIRSALMQVLLSGSMMVFPSIIGLFGYMFTSSAFTLSLLLCVMAVWFLQSKFRWRIIPALGCMVFSLSIYQSYISVAAAFLLLILIQRLLRGEKLGTVIRSGLEYVAFLVISLGSYFLATKIFLWLLHVEMNSYASERVSFSLSAIPANVIVAYRSFLLYFARGARGLLPTPLLRCTVLLCLAAAFLLLLLWAMKKWELSRYLLLAALILLLPLAINCMYLFTTPGSIHTLVLYGFVSLFVFVAIVGDSCLPMTPGTGWRNGVASLSLNVLTIAMALAILANTYIANAAYVNLHLRYENAYAFYTSLSAQIKSMPEFTEDTKLAILGVYQEPDFYAEHFPFLEGLAGVKGFLPDSYSWEKFLEYYLGFPIPTPTEEELDAIRHSPEYEEMPNYPYYGSLRLIGDTIVVKLS